MKRFLSILAIAVLLTSAIGCSCGLSCCAKSNVPTPPENAAFTLAFDDESVKPLLEYIQANTGYQPAFVDVTAADAEGTVDPARTAASACVAVLKDETCIAALEAAGWTRANVGDEFSLTVLEAPIGSTAVQNDTAVSALKVWFGGTEAKYLLSHPDLWQ
jgi:hypothetical protein